MGRVFLLFTSGEMFFIIDNWGEVFFTSGEICFGNLHLGRVFFGNLHLGRCFYGNLHLGKGFLVFFQCFVGKPLMPHCVMRRPQAGAELGLEDPGERMPRSVGTGFRRETKENNKKTLKTNKVFKESNLPSVRHDSSVRRPGAGLGKIF